MPDFAFVYASPSYWTLKVQHYKEAGRALQLSCKTDPKRGELTISDGSKLSDFDVALSILQGPPTAADGKPLARGIGGLFYIPEQEFVHGWFFLSPEYFGYVWDCARAGMQQSALDLTVGPVEYGHDQQVTWNAKGPLAIDAVGIHFSNMVSPAVAPQAPKKRSWW